MSLDLGDLGKINLIGFINNAIDYTVLTIDFFCFFDLRDVAGGAVIVQEAGGLVFDP